MKKVHNDVAPRDALDGHGHDEQKLDDELVILSVLFRAALLMHYV
jgi:hypothetical protein